MRIITTLIFLLLLKTTFSQTLIPASEKIKTSFEKLAADTSNKKLQADYIKAFPSDTKTFLSVFQTKTFDQLYSDSHKYLNELEKCATNFPKDVIDKCIDISKNLVWDADAVGQLQHLNIKLFSQNVNVFIDKFNTLDNKEQDALINFYADVENHNAYKIYQNLIDKLNTSGQTAISKKLELARTNRQKRRDH